jgi:hypothetical protein
MRKEWGAVADWQLLVSKIKHFLKAPASNIDAYSNARAAAKAAGLL